jgi:hypothetical protein
MQEARLIVLIRRAVSTFQIVIFPEVPAATSVPSRENAIDVVFFIPPCRVLTHCPVSIGQTTTVVPSLSAEATIRLSRESVIHPSGFSRPFKVRVTVNVAVSQTLIVESLCPDINDVPIGEEAIEHTSSDPCISVYSPVLRHHIMVPRDPVNEANRPSAKKHIV